MEILFLVLGFGLGILGRIYLRGRLLALMEVKHRLSRGETQLKDLVLREDEVFGILLAYYLAYLVLYVFFLGACIFKYLGLA